MNAVQYSDFANELADHARQISARYFRKKIEIHSKSDDSPVSIADREIEQIMRDAIDSKYPDHGIYGEEFGFKNPDAEFCWVIDPIDGTKSFITGHPTFGSLIALLHNGRPVLGIIEMPALAERWLGIAGRQSTFNHHPVNTRSVKSLAQSIVCATGVDFFNENELPVFDRLSKKGTFRLFGGDCYNYGLLASGLVDIVMESNLKPYDYMALVPVIENAGGYISDWQGNSLGLDSNGQVLACADQHLHRLCLDEIFS